MNKQETLAAKSDTGKRIVFALLMGLITTVIISFTIVAINIGFNERFLNIWLRSWLIAYLFVIPTILFVAPAVQKFIDRIYESETEA